MWVVRATSRGIYVLTTAPLEYTNTKTTQILTHYLKHLSYKELGVWS